MTEPLKPVSRGAAQVCMAFFEEGFDLVEDSVGKLCVPCAPRAGRRAMIVINQADRGIGRKARLESREKCREELIGGFFVVYGDLATC